MSVLACRIDTQRPITVGSALGVRVGANYLDCIVRAIEPTPHGVTADLQILPTSQGIALLQNLERLLAPTADSRPPGAH